MEFWGVQVKPGQTAKCDIEEGKLLHLTQAALGESKKGVESVSILVKFNDQKLVVGTLSRKKCAQIQYDLVFEKEFDLSHSSKNASVFFCGYKATLQDDSPSGEEDFSGKIGKNEGAKMKMAKDESDEDRAVQMMRKMFMYKANDEEEDEEEEEEEEEEDSEDGVDDEAIFDSDDDDDDDESYEEFDEVARKQMRKALFGRNMDHDDESSEEEEEVTPKKVEAIFDSDDDDDDDESYEEVDVVARKQMLKALFGRNMDHDDESSEEEEEVTPKKAAVSGKKRPAASAPKTPATEKKAKLISPAGQKTGGSGRKGAHTATPHPAKPGRRLTIMTSRSSKLQNMLVQ